jgi:hypothetical protein
VPAPRRLAKPALLLVAVAGLAIALSACAYLKFGSLSLSQPGGIGPVHVHFVICTEPEPECEPNEDNATVQYMVGIAVPPGSTPPATITANQVGGGTPLVFTKNDEVAAEMAAASPFIHKFVEEEGPEAEAVIGGVWPPSGLEGVGYLSAPYQETEGSVQEWNVDADFGLPAAADGSPFAGQFGTGIAFGFRGVSPEQPANRPVRCIRSEAEASPSEAFCSGSVLRAQIGTSDLRIAPPVKASSAFVGGRAPVKFGLNLASTVSPAPTFALKATTSVKGGKATLRTGGTFVPGPLDPATHRAVTATSEVMVAVPTGTKPGTYEVTLTGTAAQGGAVSGVGKLKVTKPKLKFGGVKLNKANGTATLKVKVPSGGRLTVAGKGVLKVKKSTGKARTLKVTIKATGKAKAALEQTGAANVKLKATFKPSSGIAVSKRKTVTLKLS